MEFGDWRSGKLRHATPDGAEATRKYSGQIYQRVWNLFQAEKVSIQTKHEGELAAYRVTGQSKSIANSSSQA